MIREIFSDEKELDLIERVLHVFIKNGLKSVTMDDVATHLHVSKKTLYKYVKNRKDLVKKSTILLVEQFKNQIIKLEEKDLNAIEENIELFKFDCKILKELHPDIHYDMQHYFKDAWDIFIDYHVNFNQKAVQRNLQKGIDQGVFRKDINTEIISKSYVTKLDMIFDGQLFPPKQFDFIQVLEQVLGQHMRGIATYEGLKLLDNIDFSQFKIK